MELSDIVHANETGENSGALNDKMVIEHFYLNVRPADAVITMSNSVDNQFCPTELWKFWNGVEFPIQSQFCVFPDLRLYEGSSFSHLIQQTTRELDIFDHIHAVTYFGGFPFIPDKAYPRPREESLRIFSEKQDRSTAEEFFITLHCDEVMVMAKIVSRIALVVSDFFAIFINKAEINIFDSGAGNRLILKILNALRINQLQSLLEIQLLALVAHTEVNIICLICNHLVANMHVHPKDMIRFTLVVNHVHGF